LYQDRAMRLSVLLLATILPACSTMPTRHKGTAIAADVAAVASAAVILNAATCEETHHTEEGWFGEPVEVSDLNCVGPALAALVIGVPLAVISGGFAIHAAAGIEAPKAAPDPAADPREIDVAELSAAVTPAKVAPGPNFKLPERETDGGVLLLAHQARRAAIADDCAAVGVILGQIEARDRAYHAELVDVAIIGACLR
jgi:hypothetical protein